jgi:hypothetical protein
MAGTSSLFLAGLRAGRTMERKWIRHADLNLLYKKDGIGRLNLQGKRFGKGFFVA